MACDTYSFKYFGVVEVIFEEGAPAYIRQPYTSRATDLVRALNWIGVRYPGFGSSPRQVRGATMWTLYLDAFTQSAGKVRVRV